MWLSSSLVRLREWLLLRGDRRVVALATLLLGFFVIGPLGHAALPHISDSFAQDHPTVVTLVSALLSGTFFLFSIVVSVNTLFVSQQQNPLGQQFGRVQSVVEFRRSLEDVVDADHVPAEPDALLRLLSGEILERAHHLDDELATADFELRGELKDYVSSLAEETGEMNEQLADAQTTFGFVRAMMDYNHDRQINDLRYLRAEYGEELTDATEHRIEEMLRLLQYFATAREYFKTLYTRREFANLSRDLVFTTVPSVALVASFLHYLDHIPDSHILVTAIEAVAFAPFMLVASYILRVAIVSKHTQAAGQFVVDDGAGDIHGIARDGGD